MLILNEAVSMPSYLLLPNISALLKKVDLAEVIDDEEIYLITLTNPTTYITV